jgi:hypothetical protein
MRAFRASSAAIAAITVIGLGLGCGGRMSGTGGDASFSPLVGGLHGRLIATPGAAGQPVAIDLELENLGTVPLTVAIGSPLALSATLVDAAGQPVAPTGSRPDATPPQVIEIPPAARRRQPVTAHHDGVAANLDISTAFWALAPGTYRLSATWASHADGGWTGQLALPAIAVELR